MSSRNSTRHCEPKQLQTNNVTQTVCLALTEADLLEVRSHLITVRARCLISSLVNLIKNGSTHGQQIGQPMCFLLIGFFELTQRRCSDSILQNKTFKPRSYSQFRLFFPSKLFDLHLHSFCQCLTIPMSSSPTCCGLFEPLILFYFTL